MKIAFTTASGQIQVIELPDGTLSWRGTYDGKRIDHVIPSPDGQTCVLLLDREANLDANLYRNLLCIDYTGAPVWVAELPGMPDMYSEAWITPEGIRAYAYSGYSVLLDRNTGTRLDIQFTK